MVSADVVGERMAGPGIRALELARALAAAGQDVTLASPPPRPALPPDLRWVEASRSGVGGAAAGADVAVVQGSGFDLLPVRRGCAVVADLYDPFPIEALELGGDVARDSARLVAQAGAGDLLLCASERQRLYYLGVLTAIGRLEPALLAVVPFGVPAGRPEAAAEPVLKGAVPGIEEGDFVALWGGGLWNWFDPVLLVRAVGLAARRRPRLKCVFLGAGHPNPSVPRMRAAAEAREVSDRLGLTGRHVFFRPDWAPYEQRGAYLAEADLGVSLHRAGPETWLAFRTRLLDYLWAGLPVLATQGDELSAELAGAGAAILVEPGDESAAAEALVSLVEDADRRSRMSSAAFALADRYRWESVSAPLAAFCAAPRRSPSAGTPAGSTGTGELAHLWRAARRSLRNAGLGATLRRGYGYLRRRS